LDETATRAQHVAAKGTPQKEKRFSRLSPLNRFHHCRPSCKGRRRCRTAWSINVAKYVENDTNGPAAENVGATLRSVEDYRLMHQAVELAEEFVDFV